MIVVLTFLQGEAEEAVKACDFDRCSIYRPGFILIDREERRNIEVFYRCLTAPFRCLVPTKFSISAEQLAKGMVNDSIQRNGRSYNLYENPDIHKWCIGKDPFAER